MSWLSWFRKPSGAGAGGHAARGSSPASQAPREAILVGPPPDQSPAVDPTATPHEVRRLLFDAVAAGDDARLESLCREHKDFMVTHLHGWLEVPPAFRASPEAQEWYGKGMREIARFCAHKLGDANLLHRLEQAASPSEPQH